MSSKQIILDKLRQTLGRTENADSAGARVKERLEQHKPNLIPQRARLSSEKLLEVFIQMASAEHCTFETDIPNTSISDHVARYLATNSLGAKVVMGRDPELSKLKWQESGLSPRYGAAEITDAVGIALAFLGIAETGTLMFLSCPEAPTSINFLPATHIVVLRQSQIVGSYEEAWSKLRATSPNGLPRTVNWITGPSRTSDIEQQLYMGAHGPKRLHILVTSTGP